MKHIFAILLSLTATTAIAADPVAIVEDTKGKLDVDFMDYVEVGRVVKLEAGDEIVLGYLRSCWRETITGGTVTIGAEQSTVTGGSIRREKVLCDGSKMRLTSDQAAKSGVMVFRAPPKAGITASNPEVTIYGLSPVLDINGGGRASIARVDQPGEPISFGVPVKQPARANFYDLAKADRVLTAGGIYRLTVGERSIVFKVDPGARPGQAPLLSRLIRL